MLRVRFAPSPTGYLHIGGARTALFNWLYARKNNGKFILRIEDTDRERSKKEYLDEILASIKWLGLDWDELYYQSQRFALYQEYAQKLIASGKAVEKDQAVFFKYQFDRVEINDLIRGKIVFNELPKEEEVIIKSDGSPTYNFCCVIDDALMEINCVVRGEDHISNTPKQILMYQALDFKLPNFAHVPLILSPDGGRMSKRYGATAISEYRQLGYLPQALVNYLLLLGFSPGDDREIVSLAQAKDIFDIKRVNKTGAAFSWDKLNWMNAEYIKQLSLEQLGELAYDFLAAQKLLPDNIAHDYVKQVAWLFRERIVKLQDLGESSRFCFDDEFVYENEAQEVLAAALPNEVNQLKEKLKSLNSFEHGLLEAEFRNLCQDLGIKPKVLIHPVRIALLGRRNGPGLFETMEVLGKEKVIARLEQLIAYWQKS